MIDRLKVVDDAKRNLRADIKAHSNYRTLQLDEQSHALAPVVKAIEPVVKAIKDIPQPAIDEGKTLLAIKGTDDGNDDGRLGLSDIGEKMLSKYAEDPDNPMLHEIYNIIEKLIIDII